MLMAIGYTPDTYTYTALIDVIARSRDVTSAFRRYEEMPESFTSHPNLVGFLTIIRAIGFSDELPVSRSLTLLDHTRRDGVFDESLYVRSIELCAKRRDSEVASILLEIMINEGVDWQNQPPILRALQRVLQRVDDGDRVLLQW